MAFKARQFDAAMATYEKARAMRPLNVYPRVKIEDLKVYMAELEEAARAVKDSTQAEPPSLSELPLLEEPGAAGRKGLDTVGTLPTSERYPSSDERPTGVAEVPPSQTRPVQVQELRSRPVLPEGTDMQEERFREGNAEVVQRTIVTDGLVRVYRQVTHPWGQVYYFLDGVAVGERVWKERFPQDR